MIFNSAKCQGKSNIGDLGGVIMDTWLELVILVLATFRLTRLIVYDKISEFIRSPFLLTVEEMSPDGKLEEYIEVKGTGIRSWIGELLSCHWCTGFWCATIVYTLYELFPLFSKPLIIILAISGCASIIQTFLSSE
jgi:hypothetical protein